MVEKNLFWRLSHPLKTLQTDFRTGETKSLSKHTSDFLKNPWGKTFYEAILSGNNSFNHISMKADSFKEFEMYVKKTAPGAKILRYREWKGGFAILGPSPWKIVGGD